MYKTIQTIFSEQNPAHTANSSNDCNSLQPFLNQRIAKELQELPKEVRMNSMSRGCNSTSDEGSLRLGPLTSELNLVRPEDM